MSETKIPWKPNEPAGDNFRGEVADNYLQDRVNKPIWHKEHEAVEWYISEGYDGLRVLDVPFGTGRFAGLYLKHGMDVYGIDISPDMLRVAEIELGETFQTINVSIGDASKLDFPDNYFDLVVCMRFLETIIPMRMVTICLKEMRRVSDGNAIVRLNNRLENLPPVKYPEPDDRMSPNLYLSQVEQLLVSTGWYLENSIVVGVDAYSEKRVCLLSPSQ